MLLLAITGCAEGSIQTLLSLQQASPAREQVRLASEAEILAERPDDLSIFRLLTNPRVLVLSFATLQAQGRMLDRVAALVERSGLPRDRVLTDNELAAAFGTHDGSSSLYYGHDYRGTDLARFFFLADRTGVRLTTEEERLRALSGQEGWVDEHSKGALVTVFGGAEVDPPMRAAMLRHELSHGEYFSNPAYTAYVQRFWADVLTVGERALFRRFLAAEGYDVLDEDLMANEMQAYLVHTRDSRFFSARDLGVPEAYLRVLQARFRADMPDGWLRDATPDTAVGLPEGGRAAPRLHWPRRGHHGRGRSIRTNATPVRVSCRRCAAIIAPLISRR